MKIIKKTDDLSLGVRIIRISVGGYSPKESYMTYRGTLVEVIEFLETALDEAKRLEKEPEVSPDEGKKYA